MSNLTECSWILIFVSVFKLLICVVLVEDMCWERKKCLFTVI